ncbi:MAG TPA: hypothetical protein DCZ94_09645 [Lentisphaeria bacterium]|nr:MAG: hypothetical protein A2X48_02725 [Lentisphaerae bacterium GWF2_49_21]HBC87205.1 hypothetical protein [Lentisphaeria bacterium]
MPALNERKKRLIIRDYVLAAILAVAAHLLIFCSFSSKEISGSKPVAELKKVVFLPLDAMPDSLGRRNFMRWIEYGDPTLISKPSQAHGFSTVYAVSGLRTPEPDIAYYVSAETANPKMKTFEEIKVEKEPLAAELARSWDYRPAAVPPLAVSIQKKAPVEYPLWRDGDGKYLPQFFSKTEDMRKKAGSLPPDKKTVLKVSFYGKDFFPRARIITSCGNQELDAAAREAFIAKSSLLPDDYRKTDEPCYIEIEWRKGQPK